MPLPFSIVCDLLEQCHKLSLARKKNYQAVTDWFARNRSRIDAHDTNLAALLSTLLPEKRTDRVYCIQAPRLEKIIGRALFLGSSRIPQLTAYKQPGLGLDLADCVEHILTATPNPKQDESYQVTVEEIDEVLHGLASKIRWSSPSIRASQTTLNARDQNNLEAIYRRLDAREAKWFTRLVLKSYQPLIFDPHLVYRLCDPALPSILKIQDDFTAAVNLVQSTQTTLLSNSASSRSRGDRILHLVKPKLGVKVGRQQWLKGRSIKHCLDMGHGRMSVEQKMDGEYCQIHFDASKGRRGLQIFSKSGKDSTEDRQALHGVILDSLKAGLPGSQIRKECILEAELVVYSDLEHKILPFCHIRNHVTRRGRLLNTEQDLAPSAYEHLMIVYYDILLLDGQSLLDIRHSDRFKFLEKVVFCSKGRAELVPRQVVDFDHVMGASNLRKAFAKMIVEKNEGLVLKPDDPYFCFGSQRRRFAASCIKLKKEYIGNFGDVGDFAVIGAGFDPAKAKSYRIPNLKWTHFYVGCLDNKEEVKRWDATPEFTVVNVVELNETLLKTLVSFSNPMPTPFEENTSIKLRIVPGLQKRTPLTVVFTNPLVFDLRCFSFDNEGNTGFWSLRFPVVSKVHFDRDFSDTVSFEELQTLAKVGITSPDLEDSQENLAWIAKLEGADPRGIAVDALSQLTATTMPTPSPRRSTQSTSESWTPGSPTAVRSMARAGGRSQPPSSATRNLSRPGDFAVPQLPLITPPTSSAPDQSSLKKNPGGGSRKRTSPSSVTASPSPKRRRSREPHTPLSSSPSRQAHKPRTRKALEEIDANSQHSATPNTSFISETHKPQSQTMAEANSSATGSFSTATSKIDSSQTEVPSSQAAEITIITIPDNEESDGTLARLSAVAPAFIDTERPHELANDLPRASCLYAGARCQLGKHLILLSDLLEPSGRFAELLDGHGLRRVTMDPKQWVQDDNERALSEPEWEIGPDKILLVDSLEKKAETRALLNELEEARKLLPEDRRDWITIYDWRVLEHLRIKEDDTVAKKYYDGFTDPWRRWYCGLV